MRGRRGLRGPPKRAVRRALGSLGSTVELLDPAVDADRDRCRCSRILSVGLLVIHD
jgi:hypothetical protein